MGPTAEIVLGPPGTGKTTYLLGIVDQELERGVSPDRIGYLSFTKRGAEEAVNRSVLKFKTSRSQFPFFRTLHSFCFRQLGLRSDDVFQGRKLQEFSQQAGIKITGRWTDDGLLTSFAEGDRILFMENLSRTRLIPLEQQYAESDDGIPWVRVQQASLDLAAYKREFGLYDYTDMLSEFLHNPHVPKLDVLLVDEGQDLSYLQWKVVWQIVQHSGCRRFVVAGDDDQAIYRWAGADVDIFMNMEGSVHVLGQSWRVPRAVQNVCNRVISTVSRRRDKPWQAQPDDGLVERVPGMEEADLEDSSILILSRNAHFLERVVEPELRLRGMLYEFRDRLSVKEETLRVISIWEALRAGDRVPVEDARQVYEYLAAGDGYVKGGSALLGFVAGQEVGLSDLIDRGGLLTTAIWHEALQRLPRNQVSYLLAARRRGEKLRGKPRIRLSTIHASKGGEADHVVLLQDMAYRTYREQDRWPDDEARVWYVGTTRAKKRLTIVEPTTRMFFPL